MALTFSVVPVPGRPFAKSISCPVVPFTETIDSSRDGLNCAE